MNAYYNEYDRQKAATLRNLIEEGAIAPGIVDERSISEIQPEDLAGFTQCHFFAGGGLWSLCLRLAGWPDDRPVWTGSCPCGPFSKAGLRKGFEDPRHLWPAWFRLVCERRPVVLFGEQSDEAVEWLDLVSTDLESRRYAIGSAIIPAAGFRGLHGRHRIGFVADADNAEWWSERAPWHDGGWPTTGRVQSHHHSRDDRGPFWMADADLGRQPQQPERDSARTAGGVELDAGRGALRRSDPLGVVDANSIRLERSSVAGGEVASLRWSAPERSPRFSGGADHDWLYCRDGRWRPVEPGLSPLADAHPSRLAQLRLYGDAIDVEAFANLIGAYLDSAPALRAA